MPLAKQIKSIFVTYKFHEVVSSLCYCLGLFNIRAKEVDFLSVAEKKLNSYKLCWMEMSTQCNPERKQSFDFLNSLWQIFYNSKRYRCTVIFSSCALIFANKYLKHNKHVYYRFTNTFLCSTWTLPLRMKFNVLNDS